MGIVQQLKLSYTMTVAAARMTMRFPAGIGVAFANLAFMTLMAVVPISTMIWLAAESPDQAYWALKYVFQFWFVENAFESGGLEAAAPAFMMWLLFIYTVWVGIVTFGSLFATTIIMHTGMMQLRGQEPRLSEGLQVATDNVWRLLGLAFVTAVVMGVAKYFAKALRAIPILGRFIGKAIVAAITGTLYVTLPIVIYERKGPVTAFRETWRHVRQTWGGLLVGTGLMMGALWVGLWFVNAMVGQAMATMLGEDVSWPITFILQLVSAVLLYCANVALSANLRAALYLHVTEGHTGIIPEAALARAPTSPTPPPAAYQAYPPQ